jgi:hypothetical protein
MNLYCVNVRHFSQKDSHTAIETFITAKDDESVYKWLDELMGGVWSDRNEYTPLINILNDDLDIIGQETYKEKIIRLNGEFYDKDLEISDRFYGVTLYGWNQVICDDVDLKCKVLKDIGILVIC